jgi:hypothetical protein
MESVAATALGKGKIVLNNRDSNQAIKISHTRPLKRLGNADLCEGGPEFPQNPAAEWRGNTNNGTTQQPITVTVDPLINSSTSSSSRIDLVRGEYIATIKNTDAVINGKHRSNARIRYITDGKFKTVAFMDKGSYNLLTESQQAYNGLSVSFKHDGGPVEFYLPSISQNMTHGNMAIELKLKNNLPETVLPPLVKVTDCGLSLSDLNRYETAWRTGEACGCVINISGQDYIVSRLSDDGDCGTISSQGLECIRKYSHNGITPAIAWPTFDGETFVATPKGRAQFYYNKEMNDQVIARFNAGDVLQKRGMITQVLFPAK